jgi:hypothetical protein
MWQTGQASGGPADSETWWCRELQGAEWPGAMLMRITGPAVLMASLDTEARFEGAHRTSAMLP